MNRTRSKVALSALIVMTLGGAARAGDSQQISIQLGSLIGSEGYCSLSYDQDAIQQYILKRVSPDDLDFAENLDTFTTATIYENEKRSASAKTAHCAQTTRVAKSLGFIP